MHLPYLSFPNCFICIVLSLLYLAITDRQTSVEMNYYYFPELFEIYFIFIQKVYSFSFHLLPQEQQNESPSATPSALSQIQAATVINGMNVRSILSNGVKVRY